jgi:hypothetical protein
VVTPRDCLNSHEYPPENSCERDSTTTVAGVRKMAVLGKMAASAAR